MRIGYAQDIHPLKEGRALILGGVHIPSPVGLDGHSDADVVLHALSEAILGALALGDLGSHFPDNDEKYRGIDSSLLLKHVISLMKERGYRMGNIDLSIVAEAPKLAPYILNMRENIAKWCETSLDQVSVKAGTNEKMDAVGRREAISAHCVVLLEK